MKIRNEVKVGILGLVAVFLIVWGYYFLKGNNILSRDIIVTAAFDNVDGLATGAPVTINGLQVGAVTRMYIDQERPQFIIAELNINRGTRVPKDASATLVTPSIMSGKAVSMEFDKGCTGEDCLQSGDEVKGVAGSMMDMAKEIFDPYVERIDSIAGVFAEVAKEEEGGLKQSVNEVQEIITNVKVISDLLEILINKSMGSFVNTMGHMEAISSNVRKNNDQITALMENLGAIAEQLKDAELDKTIASTKETIEKFGSLSKDVQGTLAETNKLMAQLQNLTDLSKQDGLLAALVNDPKLRDNVKATIDEVNLLVEDIRKHPERYRTVLSRKYKPYGVGKAYDKEQKLIDEGKMPDK